MFGLYTYSTCNIGDDIQSLAAARFLPGLHIPVHRDHIAAGNYEQPLRLIANGWHMHNLITTLAQQRDLSPFWQHVGERIPSYVPRRFRHFLYSWPPSHWIKPLFISYHCNHQFRAACSPHMLAYLRAHQPIGCRDLDTQRYLRELGVNAYFSGCLTLTLKKADYTRPQHRDGSSSPIIYFVDVAGCEHTQSPLFRSLPVAVRQHARVATHHSKLKSIEDRHGLAAELLSKYADADLVITSRLHCALPCIAFGTPVMFFHSDLGDARFAGLLSFLNHYPLHRLDEVLRGIDPHKPPANPKKPVELIEQMENYCTRFVSDAA